MTKTHQSVSLFGALRAALVVAFLLALTGRNAFAQAIPAAEASPISTGFALPTSLGSLQWGVTASQSLIWGDYAGSGVTPLTNLSGDLAYLSSSKQYPFSLIFSGGRSWSEASQQSSYTFLNLGLSQVVNVGRWNLVGSDNVSYLPGTAAAGISGIPGVGDLGVPPVQVGGNVGQGLLSNYSNRVGNDVTGKTSINATGSYDLLRFVGDSNRAGFDSTSATGGGGINHQINARTSYGGSYSYATFNYSANTFGFNTPDFASQTASGMYSHMFTRKLSLSISAGPQWTTISGTPGTDISAFADVSASYAARSVTTSLSFVRSTSNGYGTLAGAISDNATFSAQRTFALVWNCAVSSTYTHASTLPSASFPATSVNAFVEGVQLSRAIARSLSGYASYTFEHQSTSGSANGALDLFSGTTQVIGFGVTYSPSSMHFGRR
jgi:hypothetical protein